MSLGEIDALRFDEVAGRCLLVALSGGADSVALLCLLCERAPALGLRLSAAHFNHRIRGAAADADAAFCRALCDRLGVALIEGGADVPEAARRQRVGLESAAREARYRFLREARESCGADFIALAHHRDDQAETVLMHLFRGCGPDGALGMARFAGDLYRPLLDVGRASLREYLAARAQDWREDATNAISDTPRNALRLNVLPQIEKNYPSAARAVARYARYARIESDFLERLTDACLAARLQRGAYGVRLTMSDAIEEAVLRRALRRVCGSGLESGKLDELVEISRRSRGKTELPGGIRAEKTPLALYFFPAKREKTAPTPLELPGLSRLAGICEILAEAADARPARGDLNVEVLDRDALAGAQLRTRRDGDRIYPLGAPGDRLLSDYLSDKKIDRPLRDALPLVARGNRVLWVCGVGIAQTAALSENTRCAVRLTHRALAPEIEID